MSDGDRLALDRRRRVMLVTTARSYRGAAFAAAAEKLDIEVVEALDVHPELAESWQLPLAVDFSRPEEAVEAIVAFAVQKPLDAILAVDDSGAILAAAASAALGLKHNSAAAAAAARDKHRMRQLLQAAGVPSPAFALFTTAAAGSEVVAAVAASIGFPCVVKPLLLSGSRGVIRANNEAELLAAIERTSRVIARYQPELDERPFLVEQYIPGVEVALEGLLEDGRLQLLALFDKPDPLEGPYFEETIYVTPSRLPAERQSEIVACAAQAAAALGLRHGPIHAELRLNEEGPWIVEVNGRTIGGLCSQTLRFGPDISLEELILRQASRLPAAPWQPMAGAGGVMMIPITARGLLRGVAGCEAAEAVPLIESVEITAGLNYPLLPLPEGDSYLGFIFARGATPAAVEAALRHAYSQLSFEIEPHIALEVRRPAAAP